MLTETNFEKLYTFKNDSDPSGKSVVSDMYWEFDSGIKFYWHATNGILNLKGLCC